MPSLFKSALFGNEKQADEGLEILRGWYDLLCGIVRAGLCQPKLLGACSKMCTVDAEYYR